MVLKYKVRVTVTEVRGACANDIRTGQEYICDGKTPEGFCDWAYCAIYPFVATLRFGGAFPWCEDPDTVVRACPDAGRVIFELHRLRD